MLLLLLITWEGRDGVFIHVGRERERVGAREKIIVIKMDDMRGDIEKQRCLCIIDL